MDFGSTFFYKYQRFIKTIKIYLLIAGPGLIVMLADNDAGGITTYTVTGGKIRVWADLVPVAAPAGRVRSAGNDGPAGAVTKRGHAEAIFDAFGSFWGWFSFVDLAIVNWLTLITEFIGMTAALAIFGINPVITVVIVSIVMMLMVLQGKYWTWEKIALLFAALNIVYIPAAFLVHPSVYNVLTVGLVPHFPGGFTGTLFFFLMANIGTTIAPWMIFFQQSAVVDKGMKEKDIPWGQVDTLIGSAFTVLVAIFLVIVTATVLYGSEVESAAQAASVMMTTNPWLGTFIAIGLFNAGFLGAICISLASSWAFGEVFGWAHSLNFKIREAPWFYACYLFALITAGAVVLIPNAPLVLITLFVQVIAVTLLPAALVFLILLLNNEEIMGKYKNTTWQNIAGATIVIAIIVLSTLYGITTLFPELIL